jgi:nitroreductase
MDIDHLLTATRSARKTLDLDAPLELDVVAECLRIGLQAANGSNEQSWRWLVITDAQRRRELGELYNDAYLEMTGGNYVAEALAGTGDFGNLMSSTEWLVRHMGDVPALVIPCYQPYLPDFEDDASFQNATLYGSVFPAVWNFQLALHTRGYGTCVTTLHLLREKQARDLLGIPEAFVQACLLPVAPLRPGTTFRPAPRRPLEEVVALDSWDGPPIGAHGPEIA